MSSDTTRAQYTTNLPSSTFYSVAHSGDSSGQSVAPTSLPSDTSTESSISTQSVLSVNESKPTADHSLSNNTVAGIVVGTAVGLALITFLVTFYFMRRNRRSKNRRRHQRPSKGPPVPRKHRDGPSGIEISRASPLLENYLPQSIDDHTVEHRARTTLEQIGFHVETFYQSLSAIDARNYDDELATFESPYLPTPLVTLLRQSKNTIPLIVHSLAYFVTLSISPIKDPKHSLLPIEFVTLVSSVGSAETNVSTKLEISQVLSKWRVLTAYLFSNYPEKTAHSAQVDAQIQDMAASFSSAFAPWKNSKYRSKDRVRNLSEIFKQATDLGMLLFSQPSAFRFDWPTGDSRSTSEITVLPGLVKETDEKGIRLRDAQVLIEPVMERP